MAFALLGLVERDLVDLTAERVLAVAQPVRPGNEQLAPAAGGHFPFVETVDDRSAADCVGA
jgi:hypothetical protein